MYQNFIILQLSQLLASILNSRISISVLEIGPGSQSVLGHLPVSLRRKVRKYSAFEPNVVFAARLENGFDAYETQRPFPLVWRARPISVESYSVWTATQAAARAATAKSSTSSCSAIACTA